ncbi:hypothetical protein LCGC14_2463670 [marine sediment metagenome]|uniref:Uncharacterized protein n=1 Tax=marine sediment metagenome TaxID=412755 RepID=A0A0F9BCH2_9ZZZZ
MSKRFNDSELQKQWEGYEDYLALHMGQAYTPITFDEWRRKNGPSC